MKQSRRSVCIRKRQPCYVVSVYAGRSGLTATLRGLCRTQYCSAAARRRRAAVGAIYNELVRYSS
eukprot:4245761-Pleurochrysis_carterae.AAC.1